MFCRAKLIIMSILPKLFSACRLLSSMHARRCTSLCVKATYLLLNSDSDSVGSSCPASDPVSITSVDKMTFIVARSISDNNELKSFYLSSSHLLLVRDRGKIPRQVTPSIFVSFNLIYSALMSGIPKLL